ncbi:MAG TPA: HEAT repeat domain-containing protein [Planctomycetota bacterium]|nr:HEAT repeat domain-containing protein [Planctomycetota bacterium]
MRTLLLSIALALPAAALQEPAPVQDSRPEVKALVDQLGDHAGKRGKEDREAIEVIDKLLIEFPKSGPKDRALIVKGLDKCFTEKRQESAEGVLDNQLYLSAATALGEMAPESVPVFLSWIGHKSHRKDIALQRTLILKLGKAKSDEGRRPLVKLLTDKEAQVQGAAAEALGEYDGADLKVRKEVFEELLKLITTVKGMVDSDPNDTIARERYDVIAAPIITSLQRLSKHQEHDPAEWQRWWNKNKRDDWDAAGQ